MTKIIGLTEKKIYTSEFKFHMVLHWSLICYQWFGGLADSIFSLAQNSNIISQRRWWAQTADQVQIS